MTASGARSLLQHGGIYAATSMAGAALTFFVLPLYVAFLGPAGLGQVELLAVSSGALTLVVGQGLPAAWFRLRLEHEGQERRRFESAVVWYLIGSSVVALGLLGVVGPALASRFTPSIPFHPLWWLAAVTGCATVLGDLYAAGLQAEQRSLAYAAFGIGRRVLTLGTIVLLVAGLDRGVHGKLAADALAALLLAGAVLVLLRPARPAPGALPLLGSAVAYGLPLLPHAIAMQVIAMSDRFVVGHYLGLGAVGAYSLGYRIASAVEMVNLGLAGAYRTIFMRQAAVEQHGEGPAPAAPEGLARTALGLLAACGVLAQSTAILTRELLLSIGVDEAEFAGAWQVTYIVCVGMLAHASYAILATPILHAKNTVTQLPWISAVGAAVNLLGCIVFVPRFGLLAAAWATVASHATIALGALVVGRRVAPEAQSLRAWWPVFAVTLSAIGLGYACDVLQADRWLRLALKLALVCGAGLVVPWAAGFSPAALTGVLRRRLASRRPEP